MTDARRKFVVFFSLIGILTLTSAALLALAPAPLTPDASSSLFAVEAPDSMDVIFNTVVPAAPGRWQYIYVHHSRTPGGDALSLGQPTGGLGDHFVIGNGDGCIDGEIQIGQRWNHQLAATPLVAAEGVDPGSVISICLVGDFDRTVPTATQLRRLTQLVGTLQTRYSVPADAVWVLDLPNSPAGAGRYFPTGAFRQTLLP